MPLHIETMYGHPSEKTVAGPVRPATAGSFAVLDVRQRVPDISGKYLVQAMNDTPIHGPSTTFKILGS